MNLSLSNVFYTLLLNFYLLFILFDVLVFVFNISVNFIEYFRCVCLFVVLIFQLFFYLAA